jgi:hypothetical protein
VASWPAPADPDRWGRILAEAQKSGGKAFRVFDSRFREPKPTSVRGGALSEAQLFNLCVKSVFSISLICNQKYFEDKY